MGPAPAVEALAGLAFNGVAFAADMAMFDFGPLRPRVIGYGTRKGETIMVGSHSLHAQCRWRLRQGSVILASSATPPSPQPLHCVAGQIVEVADVNAAGDIALSLGDHRLEIIAGNDGQEDWRLLTTVRDTDHLVWGGDDGETS